MADGDQDLQSVRIFPDGDGFGLALGFLRWVLSMAAGDERWVPKEKAQRVQIMEGMVQHLKARLASQPGPHVPRGVNAHLYLYIQNVTHPALDHNSSRRLNNRAPAELLMDCYLETGLLRQSRHLDRFGIMIGERFLT